MPRRVSGNGAGAGSVKDRTIIVSGTATGVLANVSKYLPGASWTKTGLTGVTLATNGDASVAAAIGKGTNVAGVVSGTLGSRRVDFGLTLHGAETVPDQVGTVMASASNGQLALSWSAPANGGSAITDYLIEYKPSSSPVWMPVSDAVSASTGGTITGLTNGVQYDVRVYAVNSVGASVASSTVSATPTESLPPLVAAVYDDFKTGSGALNGRTVGSPPLATYGAIKNAAGAVGESIANIKVVTTTKGTLDGTSFNNNIHGYRVGGNYDWQEWKIAAAGVRLQAHLGVNGDPKQCFEYSTSTPGLLPYVAGSAVGTLQNLDIEDPKAGDIVRMETYNVAGVDWIRWFHNEHQIGTTAVGNWLNGAYNLTAAGLNLSGRHGCNAETNGPTLDAIMGGSASVDRLSVAANGRVVQENADGTATWRPMIKYTGRAPTELKYVLHLNDADQTPVGSGTLANLVVDDTAKEAFGTLATFMPVSSSTEYMVRVYREDAVDLNGAPAQLTSLVSAPVTFGNVTATTGQSLRVGGDTGASAGAAAPAGSFKIAASSANEYSHVNKAIGAGSNTAHYYANCASLAGKPLGWIASGLGGQSITVRALGSTAYAAVLWAIKMSGSRVRDYRHTDGNSDVAQVALYKTTLLAMYEDLWARFGQAPVLIDPMCNDLTQNDDPNEIMRRLQGAELPAQYPGKFICGPFTLDIQKGRDVGHTIVNGQHPEDNIDGYGEQERRAAKIWDFERGLTSVDRRGPKMVSLTKINDETLRVRYDLVGYDDLEIINTSYTTGKTDTFDCGMTFSKTTRQPSGAVFTTVGTPVPATGNSKLTASGGFCDVDFFFPTGTWTGVAAYARGPYGNSPFNRSAATGVYLEFLDRASMIRGVKSGERSVAIRPYWDLVTNNDFLTAPA